jgi:hypothetical protein
MDNQYEVLRLQSRLAEIDTAGEKPEMGGAILVGAHICLSGFPHLFSTDIREAFVFKNCAQAAHALAEFNHLLSGLSVIPLREESEAA